MLDLDPMKERVDKATPGPWTNKRYRVGTVATDWTVGTCNGLNDAELIAHAPTDLAALIAEVERLRAQVTILTQDHLWETGAVERVRALHKPIRWYTEPCDHPDDCDCIEIDNGEYARLDVYQLRCEVCADRDEIGVEPLPWPCPTMQALEGGSDE